MMSDSCEIHTLLCKYSSTIFVEAPVAKNEQDRTICSIRIASIRVFTGNQCTRNTATMNH